jgi:hypothetical protein
MADRVTII